MEKSNVFKFLGLGALLSLVLVLLKCFSGMTYSWFATAIPFIIGVGLLMLGYGVLIILVILGKGK